MWVTLTFLVEARTEGGTSKPTDIIEVPDDDPDDLPDSGPQNLAEAQSYQDKIDHIMDTFSEMLDNDRKDALCTTVLSLKNLMAKHWHQMSEADIEIMMKSINDPGCIYLRQHLTLEAVGHVRAQSRDTGGLEVYSATSPKRSTRQK